MEDEELVKRSIKKLIKRYSSLFVLPSYKRILLLLAFSCIAGGVFSTLSRCPLIYGLFLGCSLFFVNLISDYLVNKLVLKEDPIYDLRRTTALSLFCWVLWLSFIFTGFAVSKSFGFSLRVKFCLLGFLASLILRLIVLKCTSSKNNIQSIIAAVLSPFLSVLLFLIFWPEVPYLNVSLFLMYSLGISVLSSFTFIFFLNNVGKKMVGFSSLPFFKAFLINWITGLNVPFEKFLEKVGIPQDVEVSLMRFDANTPKAAIIVPNIHPGPFKNVGSSLLPSMIKNSLEKKLRCVVGVFHGLLGHEFDLASQIQNQKVVRHLVDSVNFEISQKKATPFIKIKKKLATVCCQIFGNSVLLSFTLAPKTTEDLPQELGQFVRKEAKKNGISSCMVVNSHNSLNGDVNVNEALNALKDAATVCLKKAASLERFPFKVGAATINPRSFSLKDGMGPGGITVVVVKVGEQKTAYIVIDGNNMVSGLREKILSNLKSQGINEGEILTTDTHSVNALILNGRGYHPIGEVMNHELLIQYIQKATLSALSNLEPVDVGTHTVKIPSVKVIGKKMLNSFSLLAEKTAQRAKKIVIPIFAATGLASMWFLKFL